MRLAFEDALGLIGAKNFVGDEIFRELRRFGAGRFLEKLADDLVELAPVDQAAAAQIPDKPFARPEVACLP